MTTPPTTMLVSLDDPNWGEINTARCKILLLEIQRKQLDDEFENRRKQLDNKLNETREKLNNLTSDQKSASKVPRHDVRRPLIRSVSQYERPATVAPTVSSTSKPTVDSAVNSTVKPTNVFADTGTDVPTSNLNNTEPFTFGYNKQNTAKFSFPFDVPREKLGKN